jgi:hypothetical protein
VLHQVDGVLAPGLTRSVVSEASCSTRQFLAKAAVTCQASANATLAIMVFPSLGGVMGRPYMAPMGIYEVGLSLWLLIKGIQDLASRRQSTAFILA